jgi:hypothetical protein
MRVLVCGGREYDDWGKVLWALAPYDAPGHTTIIQGGAKGADFLARVWAKWNGVSCEEYPADWKTYGKAAGSIRNQQMLDEGKPDLVIAFPGGTGTADMVSRAKKAGVEVIEIGK